MAKWPRRSVQLPQGPASRKSMPAACPGTAGRGSCAVPLAGRSHFFPQPHLDVRGPGPSVLALAGCATHTHHPVAALGPPGVTCQPAQNRRTKLLARRCTLNRHSSGIPGGLQAFLPRTQAQLPPARLPLRIPRTPTLRICKVRLELSLWTGTRTLLPRCPGA